MKRILSVACATLLSLAGAAQKTEDTTTLNADKTYTQVWDSIFAPVGNSYVTTGILYERTVPFADFVKLKDRDTVNKDFFDQSWHQLYNATYNNAGIRSIFDVNKTESYFYSKDTLLLGAINSQYQYLDSNAFRNDQLRLLDGQIHPGVNVQNAFKQQQLTIGALMADKLDSGKLYTLLFDKATLQQSKGKTISKIAIGIAGAPMLQLLPGQAIAWRAPSSVGKKHLNIILTLSDNSSFHLVQEIEVLSLMSGGIPSQFTDPSCNPEKYILMSDIPYMGINAKVEVSTYYHSTSATSLQCERILKKPIIVLDGIENMNKKFLKRDGKEIYENYLICPGGQLADSLRMLGFDVIIFDPIKYLNGVDTIDGGDDYMQRNAYALVKLIKTVKAQLLQNGSNEDIVIVGPSMGGQVSRYALLYMEQKYAQTNDPDWKHKCRLWVNFDSPNKGANIALSAQQYLKFWGKKLYNVKAQNTFNDYVTSPAARQMVIHQSTNISPADNDINSVFLNNSSPDRQTWMSELYNMGNYPSSCRKIAIANGSKYPGYYHQPGSKMFDFKLDAGFATVGHVFGRSSNYFLPEAYNANKTFTANVSLLLGPLHIFGIPMPLAPLPIFNEYSTIYNNNVIGAIDACPGSYIDVQKEMYEAEDNIRFPEGWKFILGFADIYFREKTNNTTFMSIVSALGMHNSNYNWVNAIPSGNLVCQNLIPFDNYYAPSINEEHIYFTKESWQWLKQEILKGQPNCPVICKMPNPVNNNLTPLCINQSRTFYHDYQVPPGASVSWSLGSGLIESASSNTSITVTANATVANTYVKATIVNPCGANEEVTYSFHTGMPYNFTTENITGNPLSKKLYISNFNPLGEHHWWSEDGINFGNYNVNPYIVTADPNYTIKPVWLKSQNNCGTLITKRNILFPQSLMRANDNGITLSPNPTNDKWVAMLPVSWEDGGRVNISISTTEGRLVKTISQVSSSRLEINAKELPAGVYFIKIQSATASHTFKAVKM